MFTSAEKEYGVETKYVLEIIETNGIIPLPGTSEGIKGVIDLRGVLVPVLHLGEGLLSSEHIMVVKVSGKPYGIMVDRVVEVFEVDETQIDRTGHVLVRECPYIKEVCRLNDKLIFIVALKHLWTESVRNQISPMLNRVSSNATE